MKNIILIVCIIVPAFTMAGIGTDQGNGGHGVRIQGSIYSFDLYESGLHKDPFFNANIKTDPVFLNRVAAVLPAELPADLVAKKLSEVKALSKINGLLLLKILENLKWRVVDSSLVDTDDGNKTPIDKSDLDMVQVAVRHSNLVRLDRGALKQMNPANKAALVLHEILYTWFSSIPEDDPTKSANSRNVVAYLFSNEAGKLNFKDWEDSFPKYDKPEGFIGYDDSDILYWEKNSKEILFTPSHVIISIEFRLGHWQRDLLLLTAPDPKWSLKEESLKETCDLPHKGKLKLFEVVSRVLIDRDSVYYWEKDGMVLTNDEGRQLSGDMSGMSPSECRKWVNEYYLGYIVPFYGHFKE